MHKQLLAALALALPLGACATYGPYDRGYAGGAYPPGGYDRGWYEDRSDWDPGRAYRRDRRYNRQLARNDRVYHGRDGRYYCRRDDGTTGLVVGGIGGAIAGGAIGGDTLGALIGAGAGALLGREVDRGNVRCR